MTAKKQPLPYKMVAGVVPCPGGWLVLPAKLQGVTILPEEPFVLEKLADVLDYRPSFTVMTLDAPVGLRDEPGDRFRQCDLDAREILGWPRRVQVPPAPSRAALYAKSFDEAKKLDPWLTELYYRHFRHYREVDEEMQPFRQRSVYSANPELCFYLLNLDQPMKYSRHWDVGFQEREELLKLKFPGIDAYFKKDPPEGASRRHIVDAGAILWTARRISGRVVQRLPQDPEWDEKSLRMEIVR
jgi:predicted RNase H-like nuclease